MNINKGTNGYVDLDLPSGTLWAKCNYGAKKETEYGNYYSWFVVSNLPLTLPSKKQFEELCEHTDNCLVVNFNGSGINGTLYKSKRNPTKYIFIPCSGFENNYKMYDVGFSSILWSSSVNTRSYPIIAWALKSACGIYKTNCYNLCSVRGVISK